MAKYSENARGSLFDVPKQAIYEGDPPHHKQLDVGHLLLNLIKVDSTEAVDVLKKATSQAVKWCFDDI